MKEEILKNSKEEPEKDIDSIIAELEVRARTLREEIQRMEEGSKQDKELTLQKDKNKPQGTSRRNFIKALTLGGVGTMLLSKQIGKDDNPPQEKEKPLKPSLKEEPSKETNNGVEFETRKCKEIIKNERYEEIIENPFLVSALYYSEQAIKKM